MNASLHKICVTPTASMRDVLQVLQTSPYAICLVVDEQQKVLGTITDGDCRRALLQKDPSQLTAKAIMQSEFVVVDSSFSLEQIRTLMRMNGVQQVPVVDDQKRLLDLVSSHTIRRESSSTAALILAGGKGKRLLPLTTNVPKPMLPVADRPMLEHLINQLVSYGITTIYLSINYLGEVIEKHFGDGSDWGCSITYLREETELGTAGPLKLLEGKLNGPILVVNGDLVTNVDFAACIAYHRSRNYDLTIGVSSYRVQIPFGVVLCGREGRVLDVQEKPVQSYAVNAGLYMVNPDLISLIPEQQMYPMTDLVSKVLGSQRAVGAFPIHEAWADVGLPDQYHLLKHSGAQKQ